MGKHEMIYLIGSLRNPEVPTIANKLRAEGFEVFDDWYAAGPEADDKWRDYEKERGHSYQQALKGHAAKNVYNFDRTHLTNATDVVLVLPAGKSGHLELGWALGKGKRGYILLDNPERWDVMYQFATGVFDKLEDLICELNLSRSSSTPSASSTTLSQKSLKEMLETVIEPYIGLGLPYSPWLSTEEPYKRGL